MTNEQNDNEQNDNEQNDKEQNDNEQNDNEQNDTQWSYIRQNDTNKIALNKKVYKYRQLDIYYKLTINSTKCHSAYCRSTRHRYAPLEQTYNLL